MPVLPWIMALCDGQRRHDGEGEHGLYDVHCDFARCALELGVDPQLLDFADVRRAPARLLVGIVLWIFWVVANLHVRQGVIWNLGIHAANSSAGNLIRLFPCHDYVVCAEFVFAIEREFCV